MKKTSVQSSNIKGIGYNPDTSMLEIEFRSGIRYVYMGVPSRLYQNLILTANKSEESLGAWFNENIKDAGFEYYRVEKGQRVI